MRRHEPVVRTGDDQPITRKQRLVADQHPRLQNEKKGQKQTDTTGEKRDCALVIRITDRRMVRSGVLCYLLQTVHPRMQTRTGRKHAEQQYQHHAENRSDAAKRRRLLVEAEHNSRRIESTIPKSSSGSSGS